MDYYQFLTNKPLRSRLKGHPFVYVTNDSVSIQPAGIQLLKFTPNNFFFRINSPVTGRLQLFQQYNHNWHAFINNKPVQIQKSNIAFMSVRIPAGTSSVEWEYRPGKVYIGIILSALSLLFTILYFIVKRKKEKI
jgi:uncharacterized membrane protein YfhO